MASSLALEVETGIPLFMDQLSETLRLEATGTPFSPAAMDATAEKHGRDLLERGFTVSQVVHDYGDVCQAITEMAIEGSSDISAAEFHTLNHCLDDAIAAAVTAYGRLKEEATAHLEVERMGRLAHELRNRLQRRCSPSEPSRRGRSASPAPPAPPSGGVSSGSAESSTARSQRSA